MGKKIIVIGSSNTDMVVKSPRLPKPGETILGGEFFLNPGGKGANQAVAAARAGGDVIFITRVGEDIFGKKAVSGFIKEGINTDYIFSDSSYPSGVALITVDNEGENSIVVAPGANMALTTGNIDDISHVLKEADILLMQLEIPLKVVEHAAKIAAENNVKVILNPAPGIGLPPQLFKYIHLLTPNETEAEIISGIEVKDERSGSRAAQKIHREGVNNVIITMGSKGALLCTGGECEMIPAPVVKAIDTTAAGDVFNGALTVALSEDKPLVEAIKFGSAAAAISVTRLGAQASAPHRDEIKQ